MNVELKYGLKTITVQIPDKAEVRILEPNRMPSLPSVPAALSEALAKIDLAEDGTLQRATHSRTVAIAIPDETRPLPVKTILPVLFAWLLQKLPAIRPSSITIIIGGGLHPPLTKADIDRLIPEEITKGCQVLSHDANNSQLADYGPTSRGTPILVNSSFAAADFKIVVGQIDPHQFVGFTGGSKGVVIGCGGAATIEHNHSLMFDDNAQVGVLHGNPVREDLNEAGEKIGIDLAINCVMAPTKEIVAILAGKPLEVLKDGAELCASLYGVEIDQKFDIVVASCGGHPKDICLYQAQKGLNLASQAVKTGGQILLLAASSQGVGDDVYFDYVSQFTTPKEVIDDFRKQEFRMGAHKAYLFGRTLTQYDVAVFSELDPGILRKCHLRAADPTKIISEWVTDFTSTPRVGVVPNANTTYFYQRGDRL